MFFCLFVLLCFSWSVYLESRRSNNTGILTLLRIWKNTCLYIAEKCVFVVDRSRGQPEGSLFISFYSEMLGRALLFSLDCSTLPLIRTLYFWVLSKDVSSTIFKVFGMTRPGIEPRSSGPLANTLATGSMNLRGKMCKLLNKTLIYKFDRFYFFNVSKKFVEKQKLQYPFF